MASTAFDSVILGNLFSTEAMRRVFRDETRVAINLDIEAALARAEARLGIIPAAAADEISARAKSSTSTWKSCGAGPRWSARLCFQL